MILPLKMVMPSPKYWSGRVMVCRMLPVVRSSRRSVEGGFG